MNLRRLSVLLVLTVAAAGCASGGAGYGGGGGGFAGYPDCTNLYPPATSSYPLPSYGLAGYYDDDMCSAYPRGYGYYPEYVVQVPVTRQVTAVAPREHRAPLVTRPDSDWNFNTNRGADTAGTMTSAPRMDPVTVSAPSPGTTTIQPRSN